MARTFAQYGFLFFLLLQQSLVDAQTRQSELPDRLRSAPTRGGVDLIDDVIPGSREHLKFGVSTNFVSDSSRVVGLYVPTIGEQTPRQITNAANSFLALLDENQQKKIKHELTSAERSKWTNLPAPPDAGGLRMADMNQVQLKNFLELLAHVLSPTGYEKMRMIMLADDQLLRNGRPRPGFGIENFSVVVFGEPSEQELWALQLDGHHLGLNVAIAGDNITIAPSFIGTQPSKFKLGEHEIRPMQTEVEAAFALANALTEEQFKTALIRPRRGRIQTGPGKDGKTLKPQGISVESFNDEQKKKLLTLISAWVGNLPKDHARKRMREIVAELDQMYFSWNGPRNENGDASYTVQGPSLIIEFAYQDLGGNPLDHIHSQYRNPKNDYGSSLTK